MADTRQDIVSRVIRYGREFIECSDGSQWTRKLDGTGQPRGDWSQVETPISTDQDLGPSPLHLSVVTEHQAENEPKHWFLFAHRPNASGTGKGQVWQVTGDAELMHAEHQADVDRLSSEDFAWHQVVNKDLSDSQFEKVDAIARTEEAPHAVNRAAVKENCQGWVIRVLQRLVAEGIVEDAAVAMLQERMDPI